MKPEMPDLPERPMGQRPQGVQEIDQGLANQLQGFHQLRWAGVWTLVVVVLLGLAALGFVVFHQSQQLVGSCQFYQDLSGAPVAVNPATHKASELSVKIVADSRAAFVQEGCRGGLPAAASSLIYWAGRYHVVVVSPAGTSG
jgi:hypothetical protein